MANQEMVAAAVTPKSTATPLTWNASVPGARETLTDEIKRKKATYNQRRTLLEQLSDTLG